MDGKVIRGRDNQEALVRKQYFSPLKENIKYNALLPPTYNQQQNLRYKSPQKIIAIKKLHEIVNFRTALKKFIDSKNKRNQGSRTEVLTPNRDDNRNFQSSDTKVRNKNFKNFEIKEPQNKVKIFSPKKPSCFDLNFNLGNVVRVRNKTDPSHLIKDNIKD